ncbi:MAG TPA: hypothetical protein VHT70_02885 [Candidatus Saccharimonadales bacterium]|jgi:hypothetical protein|nr:hypothetical protein [Candidatus Saccharimonadales bacterium]
MEVAVNYAAAEELADYQLQAAYRFPQRDWAATDLWQRTEVGLQEHDPERITFTEEELMAACVDRQARIQAQLLDAYAPLYRARAAGERWSEHDKQTNRQKLATMIDPHVDRHGNPIDTAARGLVAELTVLHLTPSYPGSPREEHNSTTPQLNNDCHWWDGREKLPQQLKYRQTGGGKYHHHVDKDAVQLIRVGNVFAKWLSTNEAIRKRYGTPDEHGNLQITDRMAVPLVVRNLLADASGEYTLDAVDRRVLSTARDGLLYSTKQFRKRLAASRRNNQK